MQIKKRRSSTMYILFLVLFIYSCGTSHKEGSTLGDVAKVNESECIGCHSGQYRAEKLTGALIVDNYIASKHNLNSVGCQDCHGGGAQHNGVGPIPYPDPSTSGRCVLCHNDSDKIKMSASRHAETATFDERGVEKCNRCHSHEGAVLASISHYTGDNETLITNDANKPGTRAAADTHGIKCDTCHTTHRPELLRVDSTWQPSMVVGATTPSTSDQYRLCTSCHVYINPTGNLVASGQTIAGFSTTTFPEHNNRWYRIIATTHFDNPNTTTIEGYVIRQNGADPCFDCHGHEFKTGTRQDETPPRPATIYTDWSKSGHAGGLLTAKYAAAAGAANRTVAQVDAVTVANVDPAFGGHASGTCARCHTSTGSSTYFTDQANWVTPSSYPTTGSQRELIYCWSCHSDAANGILRTPGAFNTTKASSLTDYSFNGAAITFSDVSGSNICVSCHSGRRNNVYLQSGSQSGSSRIHFYVAAATLFNEKAHVAYEYDLDGNGNFAEHYTNVAYFAHDKIGTTARAGTGSNGPCIACHMPSASHTFNVVTKSGSTISSITNQTLCNSCHAAHGGMTPAILEEESAGYQNAAALLKAYIHNTITNYRDADLLPSTFVALADRRDYGAVQNSFLADSTVEPGAYAHNSIYVKRILFDSINWLKNGNFNSTTIPIDTATYPSAAKWFGWDGVTAGTFNATRP